MNICKTENCGKPIVAKGLCSRCYHKSRQAMDFCGIYMIRNAIDGKAYVGSSIEVEKRWKNHICRLNANKHDNPHLQSAWIKSGKDAFEFTIIEECHQGVLIQREIAWVAYYDSMNHNRGYNLAYPDRQRMTDEIKQKISESRTGNPNCMGHIQSKEGRHRIGEAHKGNQYNKGRIPSEETKRKMSESHKGLLKGKTLSFEHRTKLSEAHKKFWAKKGEKQ